MVSTKELKVLMAKAEVGQKEIAKAMGCSVPMVCKTIRCPARYPKKSKQILLLLEEWANSSNSAIIQISSLSQEHAA